LSIIFDAGPPTKVIYSASSGAQKIVEPCSARARFTVFNYYDRVNAATKIRGVTSCQLKWSSLHG
jgi:hypothetical protein